ncbi:MAG: alpha/beta fold hydrolase [Gammaproteobacteria bacterium]|nr:alpha/beta fold hydrolase [Pseudomonadales bacterium]MCP5347000.1 alpha/beta fold hydrolase [Pseudomonadales bacterium]
MTVAKEAMPPALDARRREVAGHTGLLSYYYRAPESLLDSRPLLLLHSINAAASAHEMRPLFEHYARFRPVYALDLPGYGFSERSARRYTPRLMTDAVHDVLQVIQQDCGEVAVDALAVSLSCEFLARAARESPADFQTLALVSPTGFNRSEPQQAPPGTTRGIPWLYRVVTAPVLGNVLFRLLASPPSVRFFLRKTWGSKDIDAEMAEYACRTAKQPGASHAPFYFLSGYLFSADIYAVYSALSQPVWMVHGTRGDFTDYRLEKHFESRSNWHLRCFESGALPYFEKLQDFCLAYDEFLHVHGSKSDAEGFAVGEPVS